jgi:hypothetical protein
MTVSNVLHLLLLRRYLRPHLRHLLFRRLWNHLLLLVLQSRRTTLLPNLVRTVLLLRLPRHLEATTPSSRTRICKVLRLQSSLLLLSLQSSVPPALLCPLEALPPGRRTTPLPATILTPTGARRRMATTAIATVTTISPRVASVDRTLPRRCSEVSCPLVLSLLAQRSRQRLQRQRHLPRHRRHLLLPLPHLRLSPLLLRLR